MFQKKSARVNLIILPKQCSRYGANTRLIYATTAVVLRRLHSEPDLESIGCIIVDEVHERDVYTDFLLLLVREAMASGRMKHLKIVLMSATLRAQDFATYFAKINGDHALKPIHIPGRMFPVTVKYFEDACEVTRFMPKAKGGKGKGKGRKGGQGPRPEDVDRVWYALDAVEGNKDREFAHRVLEAVALWGERQVYIDLIEDLVHYIHENQPLKKKHLTEKIFFKILYSCFIVLFIQILNSNFIRDDRLDVYNVITTISRINSIFIVQLGMAMEPSWFSCQVGVIFPKRTSACTTPDSRWRSSLSIR